MPDLEKLRARITGAAQPTEPMAVTAVKVVRITAGELRAACDANPRHPLSAAKRRSVADFPDDQVVYVEQPDLLGIIDDARVVRTETIRGKTRVVTKTLHKPGTPPARNELPAEADVPTEILNGIDPPLYDA